MKKYVLLAGFAFRLLSGHISALAGSLEAESLRADNQTVAHGSLQL